MWQYRVVKFDYPDGDVYEVHNCNIDKSILGGEIRLSADSVEELNSELVLIQRALEKVAVNSGDFIHIKE